MRVNKRKYMKRKISDGNYQFWEIPVEVVSAFPYLGCCLMHNSDEREEVEC